MTGVSRIRSSLAEERHDKELPLSAHWLRDSSLGSLANEKLPQQNSEPLGSQLSRVDVERSATPE